jgi:uncharacterized protein YggU (UPF0235/DUF167 family)
MWWKAGRVRELRVQVKPGSRKGPLVQPADPDVGAELVVYVRERAVDGQANAAVERVLADHLGVPRLRVTIVRGHTARIKVVRVD